MDFFYSKTNELTSTAQSAVYEIHSASPSDEGSYTCYANNAAGIVEERVYIRVEDTDIYPPEDKHPGGEVCISSL